MGYKIESVWSSRQGPRDYMEDRHIIADKSPIKIWAVFDGHGGSEVSELLKQKIPLLIHALIPKIDYLNPVEVERWLVLLFVRMDFNLFTHQKYQSVGSTVCIAILIQEHLYLINIGDSRGVVFNQHGQILLETIDHKPNSASEGKRISQSYGGFVEKTSDNTHRVGGILALSRAIGDFGENLKTLNNMYLSIDSPVCPVPDIYYYKIKEPCYILLGSDGLWDVMTTRVAINKLHNKPSLAVGVKTLMADSKHSSDNVLVVLAKIDQSKSK